MDAEVAVIDLFQIVLLQRDQLRDQGVINRLEAELRNLPLTGENSSRRCKQIKARTGELRQQFDARQLRIDTLVEKFGTYIEP